MRLGTQAALAAVFALGLCAAAEAQDVIRTKSGEVKCKITAMNSKGITYSETGGKVTTVKAEDVVNVTLGDPPSSLAKAEAAIANSQYDKAISNYNAALEEITKEKKRDLHKWYILFQIANAQNQKGSPNEALETYRRLRNEGNDTWYRSQSFQRSMEIARVKGGDAYEGILKEMKSEPEPVGSQAELELAKIKYTAADFDSARAGFEKVASNPASPFAADAKLFALRCIRSAKKMDELESACKAILNDKGNSPALLQAAGAWTADLQLKKAEKDKTKWRDILMICVNAIALGPPASKDESEDYALALVTGGRLYVLMSNANDKAEAKEEYKSRAVAYYTEVKRAYGKTASAELAQKELVALGVDQPKAPEKK